ncbi:imidazole glycerol phosphate synthase subunit HisH [Leptospira kanakyensis]|uniref:imidazole glycerol phosphate synthase subunit HisH n=1 Tax=Leptospira kanakyensis TaxID=2484968 RepID=UPI00223D3EE6|nr:imidazole glycerol phosphate synthase subunit HisH [Leptospira kanakyensis]MCW7471394.1 imidazole glycerol phosphate synthase subunit HisH [Leptospira kanakyensis]
MNQGPRICIIDYGVGNTESVSNALQYLGYKKLVLSDQYHEIEKADVLILPGVGAFGEAKKNLDARNLVDILNEFVLVKKKTILGICLGMQLLATNSEENGFHSGLNWIPGKVKKLSLPEGYLIPHVGWNSIEITKETPLYNKLHSGSNFYFDHSFHYECEKQYISAHCNYGIQIAASVQKDNIFGVQFHPEKSQNVGLKLFRSFFNSVV